MDKPFYGLLPKEARIELLAQADFSTLRELCQDSLFNDLCYGDRLWELRLEKQFNIKNSSNTKEEYLNLLAEELNLPLARLEEELREWNEGLTDNDFLDKEAEDNIIRLEEEIGEINSQLKEINYLLSNDLMIINTMENKRQLEKDFKPFGGIIKPVYERRGEKEFITFKFPNSELKEEAYQYLKNKYLFV